MANTTINPTMNLNMNPESIALPVL